MQIYLFYFFVQIWGLFDDSGAIAPGKAPEADAAGAREGPGGAGHGAGGAKVAPRERRGARAPKSGGGGSAEGERA